MIKNVSILLLCILFTTALNAQTALFKRTYGGYGYTKGNSLVQTADKGYLCTGSSTNYSNGASDLFLFKTDSLGVIQWVKNYGGLNIEVGNHIIPSNDGNYLVCGYTNSIGAGGYDAYLLKLNPNGDTLWTKTFGGADWDFANEIYQAPSGSIYIAGQTYSFGNTTAPNGLLIKTNADGNEIFTVAFGGNGDESFSSLAPSFNNTIALAGYTTSYGAGMKDQFVIFADTLGNKVDSVIYGGAKDDEANDITVTPQKGVIMIGYSDSYNPNNLRDMLEVSMDTLYNVSWTAINTTCVANAIAPGFFYDQYGVAGYGTNGAGPSAPPTAFVWIGTSYPDAWLPNYCTFLNFNGHTEITNDLVKVPGGWCAIGTTEHSGPGLSAAFLLKTNFNLSDCFTPSIILANNEIEEEIVSTDLFPNPTTGNVKLKLKNIPSKLSLAVYNSIGQLVFTKNYSHTSIIEEDFSAFDNGLYLVRLVADGKLNTQRLIIAK